MELKLKRLTSLESAVSPLVQENELRASNCDPNARAESTVSGANGMVNCLSWHDVKCHVQLAPRTLQIELATLCLYLVIYRSKIDYKLDRIEP